MAWHFNAVVYREDGDLGQLVLEEGAVVHAAKSLVVAQVERVRL